MSAEGHIDHVIGGSSMGIELRGVEPGRRYSVSELARLIEGIRRDGRAQKKAIARYLKKGLRMPDGGRLRMRGTRWPGGWVVLGSDALEFFEEFSTAYGADGRDPSDCDPTDANPSAVTTPAARPRDRSAARAAGAATLAATKRLVRGKK
jgi:hypothetical protein